MNPPNGSHKAYRGVVHVVFVRSYTVTPLTVCALKCDATHEEIVLDEHRRGPRIIESPPDRGTRWSVAVDVEHVHTIDGAVKRRVGGE
jgi:hypothetical protein